jgi:signal transduction histidine kinase
MGFTSELETSSKALENLLHQSDALGTSSDPVIVAARTAISEDLPEALGFIRSSTRKMDELINAILKLSREGRRVLRPERVDLGEVILASSKVIQHQLSEAAGTITTDIRVPRLFHDRLSLENVFGNLFDNAVKYRAGDRPLEINVNASVLPGGRVAIEVRDNGRGIAEPDQERVFELFRRAGAQSEPGEGIGLAHVRAIIRNLGGEIALSSVLDAGTTFRIILPLEIQPTEGAMA